MIKISHLATFHNLKYTKYVCVAQNGNLNNFYSRLGVRGVGIKNEIFKK